MNIYYQEITKDEDGNWVGFEELSKQVEDAIQIEEHDGKFKAFLMCISLEELAIIRVAMNQYQTSKKMREILCTILRLPSPGAKPADRKPITIKNGRIKR